MTWIRLDDGIARNRKFRRAGLEALGLFVAGQGYCNEHLTDGFIPREDICLVAPGVPEKTLLKLATKLETNNDPSDPNSKPSWVREAAGWRVHAFHEFQPSKADVLKSRERERERKGNWRRRISDCPAGTDAGTDCGTPTGHDAESRTESTPESGNPVPSRPDPTHTSGASHRERGSAGEHSDSWMAEARDRILAVYPVGHDGGLVDAERALFELARQGILVPDGEPIRHRVGTTPTALCRSIEKWKQSDLWQRGKVHNLRTFLEKAIYLTPAPVAKLGDDRRAAGAHESPQPSRLRRIG